MDLDVLADGSDGHLAVGAVHQLHLQQAFQLLNGVAEGGLGNMAQLGSLAKVPGFLQGDKVPKLFYRGKSHELFNRIK